MGGTSDITAEPYGSCACQRFSRSGSIVSDRRVKCTWAAGRPRAGARRQSPFQVQAGSPRAAFHGALRYRTRTL